MSSRLPSSAQQVQESQRYIIEEPCLKKRKNKNRAKSRSADACPTTSELGAEDPEFKPSLDYKTSSVSKQTRRKGKKEGGTTSASRKIEPRKHP